MLYTQLSRTYHALYLILHTNYPSVRPTPHLYSSFFTLQHPSPYSPSLSVNSLLAPPLASLRARSTSLAAVSAPQEVPPPPCSVRPPTTSP
jgi:hypothetical protein